MSDGSMDPLVSAEMGGGGWGGATAVIVGDGHLGQYFVRAVLMLTLISFHH